MKLIDRYILKQYIVSFLFAIGILAVISCVIDYVEKIDALVTNKAPFGAILQYFMTFIPHIVALLYPLFIFVSTIFFTSKLAYRSEFIAIQAAGVPIKRILRPYLMGSIIIGLVSLTFNHLLVPMANKVIYEFEEEYIRNTAKSSNTDVHIRLSPRLYVYTHKFDLSNNTGRDFTEERFEGTLLKEKIFAEQVVYADSTDTWILRNVTIRTNEGRYERLEKKDSLIRHYKLVPKDFTEDIQRKATLTSPELYAKTNVEQSRGLENVNAYGYELHRRTADSCAGIILTVIAVTIATRKIRGGSGLHLAIGIVISAFFLLFMQFAKTFSVNANLSPLLGAWIPNIVFAAVAYLLYLWRSR